MMIKLYKRLLTVSIALFLITINSFAQPGGGNPGGGGAPVPFSGIEILIGSGLFYGVKRIINSARGNTLRKP